MYSQLFNCSWCNSKSHPFLLQVIVLFFFFFGFIISFSSSLLWLNGQSLLCEAANCQIFSNTATNPSSASNFIRGSKQKHKNVDTCSSTQIYLTNRNILETWVCTKDKENRLWQKHNTICRCLWFSNNLSFPLLVFYIYFFFFSITP